MKPAINRRLARAQQNIPPAPPDLSSMDEMAHLMWAMKLVGHPNLVRAAVRDREAAERTDGVALEPKHAPEPPPVEAKPPPPAKPRPPRHVGEPDPDFVPPQNQYWETMCRFRFRGLDEPYDDEPPEQDELDELIYGS